MKKTLAILVGVLTTFVVAGFAMATSFEWISYHSLFNATHPTGYHPGDSMRSYWRVNTSWSYPENRSYYYATHYAPTTTAADWTEFDGCRFASTVTDYEDEGCAFVIPKDITPDTYMWVRATTNFAGTRCGGFTPVPDETLCGDTDTIQLYISP